MRELTSEDGAYAQRASHPYRGDNAADRALVEQLERENGRLRALVVALAFALFVVAGAAGVWLSTLSRAIHP